jgi:hypothetical protein
MIKAGGDLKVSISEGGIVRYGVEKSYAPLPVRKWLGLSTVNGKAESVMAERYLSLVDAHDSGLTFEQIADIIESEPEGLFVEAAP